MQSDFEDPTAAVDGAHDRPRRRTLFGACDAITAYDPAMGTWSSPRERRARRCAPISLHLKPWTDKDAAAYHALLDDPAMWRFLPEAYPDPLTVSDARALIAIASGLPHHIVRAVWQETTAVGQVRVEFNPRTPREAEISYWIGRDFWGKGLAAEAVRLFAQEVFAARSDIAQLIARIHPENGASRSVIEKAGFVFQEKRDDSNGWHIFARRR